MGMKLELRDVPGWPGYLVGSDGSVWSRLRRRPLPGRKGTEIVMGDTPRQLKPKVGRDGYPAITLTNCGARKSAKVHRLVAECFLGPIPDDMQVNHKNGIKRDCRLVNLEIVTPTENRRHAYRTGLQVSPKGEENGHAKLTAEQVREIRSLRPATGKIKGDLSTYAIAKRYGVSRSLIRHILHRKQWRHV